MSVIENYMKCRYCKTTKYVKPRGGRVNMVCNKCWKNFLKNKNKQDNKGTK